MIILEYNGLKFQNPTKKIVLVVYNAKTTSYPQEIGFKDNLSLNKTNEPTMSFPWRERVVWWEAPVETTIKGIGNVVILFHEKCLKPLKVDPLISWEVCCFQNYCPGDGEIDCNDKIYKIRKGKILTQEESMVAEIIE